MQRVEKTVFISYRRSNFSWALAIYQHLTRNGYDVFLDYTGIAAGDFETAILGNIVSRAHFLVVLTPSALERCQQPGDWLRREIETAIQSKRNVIPLMLEGFDFGTPALATQLSGKLAALKQYQALNVHNDYFEEAMARLQSRYLNIPLSAVSHPASTGARRAATRQKAAAKSAAPVKEQELTAQEWFEQGYAAANLDEQIRCYTKSIRLNPRYAAAFYNRGSALIDKGDLEKAIKDYAKAIRLTPDDPDAFYGRGYARADTGDFDGAIEDYTQAIRLKPNYTEAFYNRGLARAEKNDVEGAIEDYTEAMRLNPDDAKIVYARAAAHRRKDNLGAAIKDYTKAIRLKPEYAHAFFNRALILEDKGDLDGAIKDHTKAIQLNPLDPDPFYGRGYALRKKGDLEEAIADYTEAIRLKPDYADAIYSRALARQAKGDAAGAKKDFEQAKRLKSGN